MKKVFCFFMIFVLLFPLKISACPHVDKAGVAHFQFYNDDYTEMTMIYPKVSYLYGKVVTLIDDDLSFYYDENDVLAESFGFPLVQDKEAYWQYYWFTDESLQSESWQNNDLKTTIEGIDSILVTGIRYNLKIALYNTFAKSQELADEKVYQLYYNILVDILAEDESEAYLDKIVSNGLELLTLEIIKINANFTITDYDFFSEQIDIDKLFDEIEVQLYSDDYHDNTIIVNLNKPLTSSDYIECNYDNINKYYSFVIEEPGVFVMLNKNEYINNTEKEDNKSNLIEQETSTKADTGLSLKETIGLFIVSAFVIGFILIVTVNTLRKENN